MSDRLRNQLKTANARAHQARHGRGPAPRPPQGQALAGDPSPVQGEGYYGRDGLWYSEDHHAYPSDN